MLTAIKSTMSQECEKKIDMTLDEIIKIRKAEVKELKRSNTAAKLSSKKTRVEKISAKVVLNQKTAAAKRREKFNKNRGIAHTPTEKLSAVPESPVVKKNKRFFAARRRAIQRALKKQSNSETNGTSKRKTVKAARARNQTIRTLKPKKNIVRHTVRIIASGKGRKNEAANRRPTAVKRNNQITKKGVYKKKRIVKFQHAVTRVTGGKAKSQKFNTTKPKKQRQKQL